MKNSIIPALSILLAAAMPAIAASPYLETFSDDNDDQGFFVVSNGALPSVSQNPTTDRLEFNGADSTLFYIAADAGSSNTSVFAGDYITGGVYGFTFDLTINNGSSVTEIYFEISNLTEDETWQYTLTLPTFGTDTSFLVPLSPGGWTQTSGNESFNFILGQTEDIGIVLASNTSGPLSGSLDNFASIPEPSAFALSGLAGLVLASRRRRAA